MKNFDAKRRKFQVDTRQKEISALITEME